jgi:uncharacterized membrane protein YoaK (UPF0700 family)
VPPDTHAGEPVAPLAGPLLLVVALAAVTGCLDAVSLARITHTFVGFQTGNLVLVGLGVGRRDVASAAGPAVAVLAYLGGSVLTPTLLRTGAPSERASVRRLLSLAASLLVVNVVVVLVGAGVDGPAPTGATRYASIVVSALAMACQTPVVRRVAGVSVSSTFSTGMLTRLGQSFGALRDPALRPRELIVARVLGSTVVAFVVGAIVGGLALRAFDNGAVVAPAASLVLVWALVVTRRIGPHGG